MKKPYLLGTVFACVFAGSANSSIIYYNGLPNPNIPLSGFISDPVWPNAVIDDFSLNPFENVVETIRWWGTTTSGNIDTLDNFTISIYDDSGSGSPAKSIHDDLSLLDITKELIDNKYFEYTASITPISFTPNQTFWLSIQNNSIHYPIWIWRSSSDVGGTHYRDGTASDWELYYNSTNDINLSMAFQLEGVTVPIPSAAWLFGSGLLGLLGIVKRKKT